MKISPNRQDTNQIKRMHGEGLTCADIARRLRIKESGVQTHMESTGLLSVVEELTPQQRGANTRRKNAEAALDLEEDAPDADQES
jgi:hypothetical protein